MSKRDRAIELRELSLTVVRAHGSWQTAGNRLRLLTCDRGDLRIALQTPFQQQPSQVPSPAKYLAAQSGKPSAVNLPYVIDVWDGGKVLSVQWADDGTVLVVSYKPGVWERDLERHANEAAVPPEGLKSA